MEKPIKSKFKAFNLQKSFAQSILYDFNFWQKISKNQIIVVWYFKVHENSCNSKI